MLSPKLLETIDRSFIGRLIERKAQLWDNLNPDKFYIENIRSFYNLPFSLAKLLCDIAVRMGIFEKRYEVICPKHSSIAIYESKSEIPEFVDCEICIQLEEIDFKVKTVETNIMTFYKLAIK